MTITRPCRRITRHLLQIFLTLGLTFTVCALLPIPAAPRARAQDSAGNRPLFELCLRTPSPRREAAGTTVGPTVSSLVAVDDSPAGQVVWRQLHHDPVLGQDADVVLAHLAADVGQDLVAVGELYPEHRVRERLDYPALDLDGPVFLRHVLRYLTSGLVWLAHIVFHGCLATPAPAAVS